LPPRKPKISTSDRDILRMKPRQDTTYEGPPPRSSIPPLGSTPEDVIAYMNAITLAVLDGEIDEKKGDTLTAMARTALNAIKHRDMKVEDRELDEMLRRAEAVEAAGLRREADDRRHVTRGSAEPDPEADAEGDDGDE
jgi:hypothetical protein